MSTSPMKRPKLNVLVHLSILPDFAALTSTSLLVSTEDVNLKKKLVTNIVNYKKCLSNFLKQLGTLAVGYSNRSKYLFKDGVHKIDLIEINYSGCVCADEQACQPVHHCGSLM